MLAEMRMHPHCREERPSAGKGTRYVVGSAAALAAIRLQRKKHIAAGTGAAEQSGMVRRLGSAFVPIERRLEKRGV
jgi:hypothetical protein